MRSYGETFPLHACAGDSGKLFIKLLFDNVEPRHKIRGHFIAQSARASNIKPVAAAVNNCVNIHAPANVVEITTAKDCDWRMHGQRLQRLPHGTREKCFLGVTYD